MKVVSLYLHDSNIALIDAYADLLQVSRAHADRLLHDWLAANPPTILDLLSLRS